MPDILIRAFILLGVAFAVTGNVQAQTPQNWGMVQGSALQNFYTVIATKVTLIFIFDVKPKMVGYF